MSTFGQVGFFGSTWAIALNKPIVAMAGTSRTLNEVRA
jgi:hypothetical protein